jgi:hypothetical protein
MTTLSLPSRITSSSNSFQPGDRLLDQDLVDRGHVEAPEHVLPELLGSVREALARAAERPGRPDDDGQPDLFPDLLGVLERADDAAPGHVEADAPHRGLEEVAVFGALDRVDLRADELAAVLLEDAGLGEVEREVQPRLAADRRQHRVGSLGGDDALEDSRP